MTSETHKPLALLVSLALLLLPAHHARGGESPASSEGGENFPAFKDAGDFLVLSYHGVAETREDLMLDSVTQDHLVFHFEWLLDEGYNPVSVQQILDARAGGDKLPPKAILLSFDDGYRSFHERVFPLLKAYRFPAVLCLVTRWMDAPAGGTLSYGKFELPRSEILTWEQVRDMDRSGLVEIASHSHDLHHGIIGTREGNKLAAAAFLEWKGDGYESRAAHRERVRADLRRSQEIFRKRLGHAARVLVWPYGRYNMDGVRSASGEGFEMCLTLNEEPGRLSNLMETGRLYLSANPAPSGFRRILENPRDKVVGRFPMLDIEDVLGGGGSGKNPPPAIPDKTLVALSGDGFPGGASSGHGSMSSEELLSHWLDRSASLAPDGVAIRPWGHDGNQVRAAFPSHVLPLSQDRLLRTVWQTQTRGESNTLQLSAGWLWLVNDRPSWNWSDVDMMRTWPELAPFAPVQGVVIGGPGISPAVLDLVRELPPVPEGADLEETTGTRRENRQALLRDTSRNATLAGQTMSNLESFQGWRPFTQVFLLIPWKTALRIDEAEHRKLVTYFDRVAVDAREVGRNEVLRTVKKRPRDSWLVARSQMVVDFSSKPAGTGKVASLRLNSLLTRMEHAGVRSWVYDKDLPNENLPLLNEVRTVMSAQQFPWNLREFRLFDEEWWPIHNHLRPVQRGEKAPGALSPGSGQTSTPSVTQK